VISIIQVAELMLASKPRHCDQFLFQYPFLLLLIDQVPQISEGTFSYVGLQGFASRAPLFSLLGSLPPIQEINCHEGGLAKILSPSFSKRNRLRQGQIGSAHSVLGD